MAYRALELVIHSAQNLRNEHTLSSFRNLKPFALVSIRDINNNAVYPEQQTTIDQERQTNPIWDFHVIFNIDITRVVENQLALVVTLKSRRKSGDKDVGKVRVPITELEGFGDANDVAERHLSRNVNLDGTSQQGQGTLNFSYRFGNTVQHPPASTVNNRNHPPQNVPQRPGVAKRVVNRFREELCMGMASAAAMATVGAAVADDEPDDTEP